MDFISNKKLLQKRPIATYETFPRYIQDGMRLIRHSGRETQGLYNYLTAVATPRSPLVVLHRDEGTFSVGRMVVHHSGVPMAVIGFNISAYLLG